MLEISTVVGSDDKLAFWSLKVAATMLMDVKESLIRSADVPVQLEGPHSMSIHAKIVTSSTAALHTQIGHKVV